MTDKETLSLLKRISEGDEYAFEVLAEKYRTLTDTAASRAQKSLESSALADAENVWDLRQEAQLALYKAALRYDREGMADKVTFGLFAKICVRNAMISQIRRAAAKRRRHEKAAMSYEKLTETGTADVTSERAIYGLELERILQRSGSTLSEYERAVLMLYLQGKSSSEIAVIKGRSAKSVSNAIYRIKVKLKGLSE